MSELKTRLSSDMKTAMKAGDKDKLTYARNLHAIIRKKEIDERVDVTDDEFTKIVSTSIKQRRDSIEQFKKGGRDDLVAKEEAELNFLMTFLPPQLSEAEIQAIVDQAIQESGASSQKEMGQVMKLITPKTQGRADGKLVSQIVRSKLGG